MNSSKFKLVDMPCSFFDQISSTTGQNKYHQQLVDYPFGATFAIVPVGGMGGGIRPVVDEISSKTGRIHRNLIWTERKRPSFLTSCR
jgi:hypothetical protein